MKYLEENVLILCLQFQSILATLEVTTDNDNDTNACLEHVSLPRKYYNWTLGHVYVYRALTSHNIKNRIEREGLHDLRHGRV
jgi:hypothetical protein